MQSSNRPGRFRRKHSKAGSKRKFTGDLIPSALKKKALSEAASDRAGRDVAPRKGWSAAGAAGSPRHVESICRGQTAGFSRRRAAFPARFVRTAIRRHADCRRPLVSGWPGFMKGGRAGRTALCKACPAPAKAETCDFCCQSGKLLYKRGNIHFGLSKTPSAPLFFQPC